MMAEERMMPQEKWRPVYGQPSGPSFTDPVCHSGENWIEVKPRDGKPPLLAGCVTATLKEGKGRFDNLQITDNSSFVCDKKFRLGFKTQLDSGIQGAFSEAICVKDARGKCKFQWPFLVYLPSLYCSVQHVLGA
jgi:hypothetical protein